MLSCGAGYWGSGTLPRQDVGGGKYRLIGTGEPHGVIRFLGTFDSITWPSLTNENWTRAPTGLPEPSTLGVTMFGLLSASLVRLRRK